MKKQNKIILGALIVLLGVGIVLWSQRHAPPAPARPAELTSELPKVAPTPPQPQPTEPPKAAVNPQRKYAEMDVLERNAILTEIGKQDLPAIFQAMLDAERVEHQGMKQMHLQSIFAEAFKQKTPTPEFVEQLRVFVTNSANLQFERDLVFGALGSAATPETVKLLVDLATTSRDQKIRYAATGSLGTVGGGMGGGEKLSPMLERVWSESGDQLLLMNVSPEMAKIGAPSGIELLLSAALATDGRDNVRMDISRRALKEIYTPKAVPPLAARLANQPPTSPAGQLVAPILVRIGDAAASKAIVSWLQERGEDATPLIANLVRQQTRSETMLAAWAAALDPLVPFRNEQNREAIRAGLAEYRAGHIEQK